MNRTEATSYIYEQFEQACLSLFEGLSCNVAFAEETPHELENAFIAIIDAGSAEMELQLYLRMPFSVLALTYPSNDATTVEEEKLQDWMAELSNMLIGQVKTNLLKHDIQITIGLPESHYDVDYFHVEPAGFESKTYCFDIDHIPVECRIYLDLMVDELDVSQKASADEDVDNGDLEFF